MLGKLGFVTQLKPSSIKNAGQGVFVTQGKITAGSLVALYPGIYLTRFISPESPTKFRNYLQDR